MKRTTPPAHSEENADIDRMKQEEKGLEIMNVVSMSNPNQLCMCTHHRISDSKRRLSSLQGHLSGLDL